VKFRSVPPDPDEFPRFALWGPPLLPLAIFGAAWLADFGGHKWNVHGDAVAMFMLFLVAASGAFISSAIFIALAIPALRQHASLRTRANLLSVVVSGAYVLLAILGATYGVSSAT
jgi:hypothetical protein